MWRNSLRPQDRADELNFVAVQHLREKFMDTMKTEEKMRVRVYRNLNKGGISIQCKTENGWRVCDYTHHVVLENCTFKVLESGRQRVLRTQQKNVHAWVEGDLVAKDEKAFLQSAAPEPYYNPYTLDHFEVNGVEVQAIERLRIFCPPRNAPKNSNKKSSLKTLVQTLCSGFFWPFLMVA